jgi:hypothetical protein
MAIAVDASTPVRWTGAAGFPSVVTSASFTAPTDALLVCCVSYDTKATAAATLEMTASDSGGLTWTKRVERTGAETTGGGGSAIFTARTTSAVARTVSCGYDEDEGVSPGTMRISAKLYVLTGVDVGGTPVDAVGANNEGGSGTNNLTTTSITAGANGLLICADTDWNVNGVMTSSDLTIDSATYASAIDVASGYKAVSSGASVNGNLNAGGGGAAQHKWCQVVVREAAGGGGGTIPHGIFGKPLFGPFGGVI